MPIAQRIGYASAVLLLLYVTSVVIYRLVLHPLARYPGPLLAKITSLYDAYHCYAKDRHLDQERCHKKYGQIVRYGPNFLIINTSQAIRDIYTNAKANGIIKSSHYNYLKENGVASTIAVRNPKAHGFKRRVLSQVFSDHSLREFERCIVTHIHRWVELLGSGALVEPTGWSSPKDMALWSNYVTFDILGELCFGKSFNTLSESQNRDLAQLVLNRTRQWHMIGNSPLLPLWSWIRDNTNFEKYIMPTASRQIQKLKNFAQTALTSRLKQQMGRRDVVSYLQSAKDPYTGKGFEQAAFLADLRFLIIAGSDTSAIVIAAAFFYLVHHLSALQRLQQELRYTFDREEEIVSGAKLSSCRYLRAVIDETMRLSPPVTSSLTRDLSVDGTVISGQALLAGTKVGTSQYAIHRSEQYFTEPTRFKPERWRDGESPREEILRAQSVFNPFSSGVRGCLGKPLAYAEMSIALGRALFLYDIRRPGGDETGKAPDGTYQLKDVFVAERSGPIIEFRRHVPGTPA